MRRTELKNIVREFAAEMIATSEPFASGRFDDFTDEEQKLVGQEIEAIARRIRPEQAFIHHPD